jgi:hypothetical protein
VETAQVLTLQQSAASTLQAGSAWLTFLTPTFTSDDDFATITISVLVGGSRRSASFPFEYMPAIVGAARVLEFFPKNVFVTQDLQLLVKMENVQRLQSPFSSADIKARFEGLEIPAEQMVIVSSSRIFTVVRMSIPYNATQGRDAGALEISVGRDVEQLGSFNVSVVPVPSPQFVTGVEFPSILLPDSSPRRLPPDQKNILKVQIQYLEPNYVLRTSASKSFFAEMMFTRTGGEQSNYDVALLPGYPKMDEGCKYAHCSIAEFKLAVDILSKIDQEAGGTGSITLKASSIAISTFEYVFKKASDPEVVGWNPKALPLDGGVSVNIYVKNFPQAGCSSDLTCAQKSENLGLSVQIDSATLAPQSLQDSNGMLVVAFVAPASEMAGSYKGALLLRDVPSVRPLEFTVSYPMPPAEISNLEGRIEGGDSIAITIRGWWKSNTTAEEQKIPTKNTTVVSFGDIKLNTCTSAVSKGCVDEVGRSDDGVSLLVKVRSPAFKDVGNVLLTVSDESSARTSQVMFEYFRSPRVVDISPVLASISGKTVDQYDSNSIVVTLQDFPPLTLAGDFKVKFSDAECGIDNMECAVLPLFTGKEVEQTQTGDTKIRIKVPPQMDPGDVKVSIERRVIEVGRFARQATTVLKYFRPPPVLKEAKWCEKCNYGVKTCIAMGRCGDGKRPMQALVPARGTGRMTLVIEAFLRWSTVRAEDVSLALGTSNYGSNPNVVFQGAEVLVLEFDVPSLSSPTGNKLVVTLEPEGALSPSSASLQFSFVDDSISLQCLQGCESASNTNKEVIVAITNFPLSQDATVVDTVLTKFGDIEAISIEREVESANCTGNARCFRIVAPRCDNCAFSRGCLKVTLSLSLRADPSRGSQTEFTYWKAPVIELAQMDPLGTSVSVIFDQRTNQAGMSKTDSNCSRVLDVQTLSMLAADPKQASCVWVSPASLKILLASGATIFPRSLLRLRDACLKSENAISDYSSGSDVEAGVSAPDFLVAPVVAVYGSNSIDPCSELVLEALADSPRALMFE